MRTLGRIATIGALVEVTCWVTATAIRPGSWRYDISALYAAGSPRPWLVMVGESALGVALGALAIGLWRCLPHSDHRIVGCALLAVASVGEFMSGLTRDSCEESVPACSGHAYTTPADWIEAAGSLLVIFGVAAAALVLATTLPRRWSIYSMATGAAVLCSILAWQSVPYPWVGSVERLFALAVAAWVAALGRLISRTHTPAANCAAARPRTRTPLPTCVEPHPPRSKSATSRRSSTTRSSACSPGP